MAKPKSAALSNTTPANKVNVNDLNAPAFTHESLARRFSEKHGDKLRYVAAWGKWFVFTGKVWEHDETLRVVEFARELCVEESRRAIIANDAAARKIVSASAIAAVERLARADRRHAATTDQWDKNPLLLNTPDGVIDLRTGELLPHNPMDYHSKITAVAPGGDCPIWHEFLRVITGGDTKLQEYLQRVLGYALTGITREHAMFFLFGPGGNGKSVLLNTITDIMKGYATVSDPAAFTATPNPQHPAGIDRLQGARLVTAQETDAGRGWAEGLIKGLVAGDPTTARPLYGKFTTFIPACKLVVAGNQKPSFKSVDDGIRRRFNVVPLTAKICPGTRDPELSEKLKAEWPGILAWMIEGCILWQRHGLNPPPAVTEATTAYLEAEDPIGRFLAECCIIDNTAHTPSGRLFLSWSSWAEREGEVMGTSKNFSKGLISHGFKPKRMGGDGRAGFLGVRLKTVADTKSSQTAAAE